MSSLYTWEITWKEYDEFLETDVRKGFRTTDDAVEIWTSSMQKGVDEGKVKDLKITHLV